MTFVRDQAPMKLFSFFRRKNVGADDTFVPIGVSIAETMQRVQPGNKKKRGDTACT